MGSCFVEFLFFLMYCSLYGCLSDMNLMFYTCWHLFKEKALLQVLCYAFQYTKTFMLFDILLLCCLSDAIPYVSYMVIMFIESLNNYSRGPWITAAGKKNIGLSIQLIIYQLALSFISPYRQIGSLLPYHLVDSLRVHTGLNLQP